MNWFKKRRQALIRDIAAEVIGQLEARKGWKKFLPPVALRDSLYMVTEDGAIYVMKQDHAGMEVVMQIRH